jgi:feruloyl esterase
MYEGTSISPGYPCSGEAEPGGWAAWLTGKAPETAAMFQFSTQFFKNMVYNDPNWDYRKFNLERDSKAAEEKMGRHLNAVDPDLSRFRARGGKLILYHGWNDAAIPAWHLIEYYDRVLAAMGREEAASFVRLFLAPGVQHCAGGAGPNNFGQGGRSGEGDALHDIDAALEQWVEEGVAPERLVATHAASKRTRPLCPYPLVATWQGSGSTDDEANFTCAAEKR